MLVSVIIPTMCESRRRDVLCRAIDSVLSQRRVAAELILVVNGQRYDPHLLSQLQELPIRIERLSHASLPEAIRFGRLAVRTKFYGFLDDDDIYLPDALAARSEALASCDADFVVSNGFRTDGDPLIRDVHAVATDPLRALLVENWLTSCGGLYRTATVPVRFFENLVKFYEWTVLAFELLMAGKKARFIDQATFQIFDTQDSASKQRSMESTCNAIAVVEDMFGRVPAELRRIVTSKRASIYHDASFNYLESGHLALAWRTHLLCLVRGGWRYASATRDLMRRTCAAWFRRSAAPTCPKMT